LAFGSADHCVHLYDLRNTNEPLKVFRGHQKAVSYVKFLNDEEIVSASTDNQLRLWHVRKPVAVRAYSGHVNEKNFVGLTTNGEYVACGSENNSLFVYYRGFSKNLLAFQFDPARSIVDRNSQPTSDQSNDFVSAVCWRLGSNVMLAANSRGIIRVLELV
jgi:E3 ubiquitin-protein ligase RFWD2